MTRKKHRQHKKRPSLAEQLGITYWSSVMSREEKQQFHKMLISCQMGIHPDYHGQLRQYLVETLPKNRRVLKYLQRKKKGWHQKDRPLEAISSFLERKLAGISQIRVGELVNSVDRVIREQSDYARGITLMELYHELESATGLDEEKRSMWLNRLADELTGYKQKFSVEGNFKDYIDFAVEGKENFPKIHYHGDENPVIIEFSLIETWQDLSSEFRRGLNGDILDTRTGCRIVVNLPDRSIPQDEIQAGLKPYLEGSIRRCGEIIAQKRDEGRPHDFFYKSRVQSDYDNMREQAEGEDPFAMEQIDNEAIQLLAEKYGEKVEAVEDFVFNGSNGRIQAAKVLKLKPGFLQSYEGMHPREVAEKLCSDIEEAYSIVTSPAGPANKPECLENRLC